MSNIENFGWFEVYGLCYTQHNSSNLFVEYLLKSSLNSKTRFRWIWFKFNSFFLPLSLFQHVSLSNDSSTFDCNVKMILLNCVYSKYTSMLCKAIIYLYWVLWMCWVDILCYALHKWAIQRLFPNCNTSIFKEQWRLTGVQCIFISLLFARTYNTIFELSAVVCLLSVIFLRFIRFKFHFHQVNM